MKKIIKKVFGHCPWCGRWFVYPKRRRMSTDYVKKEANYYFSCKRCFEEKEKIWEEQWKEYYRLR